MRDAIEKIGIAKSDVFGTGRDLLADIGEHDFPLNNAELARVNGNDGTVSAQMLAAAARFGVADSARVAAGQIQLCIPGERR